MQENLMQDIWFSDSESFKYDWLFCFKSYQTGEKRYFWNEDADELLRFLDDNRPILCGYNFRGYDSNILKGILLGWSPSHINDLSQTIVTHDDMQDVFDMFTGEPFVTLPPVIDLIHDIVPRKSLKEIEGNVGMSIEESSVPFGIDRLLTGDERAEVLEYCWHDVAATEMLYGLRTSYLQSKVKLCDLCGLDPLDMLKHTNARLVAEALGAQKYTPLPVIYFPEETDICDEEEDHEDYEDYTESEPVVENYDIPDNVVPNEVPQSVLDFMSRVNTNNCEEKGNKLELTLYDCPIVVGYGGIHGAVLNYHEESTEDRVILHQDVNSYYPSLIIQNRYMSRGVPARGVELFKEFYDLRISAKARKDTETANAAKLVLNTTYGTFKSKFSKMYDPMMGTRVCFAGELYLLMLLYRLSAIKSLKVIQLNTDGIFVSVDRSDLDDELAIVEEWERVTKMTIGTDEIATIIQRDVNNYVIRYENGKIETKGGTVGHYHGGDFKSNSETIVDDAIVDYLLYGVPIADTVNACEDLQKFQIIAKAGQGYNHVYQAKEIVEKKKNPATGRMRTERRWVLDAEVNRVNRVYAVLDRAAPTLVKTKLVGEKEYIARIPNTPENCRLDNGAKLSTDFLLTGLDRQWYIDFATKQAMAFETKEGNMAENEDVKTEETTEAKPVRKRVAKKETVTEEPQPVVESAPAPTFKEKLFMLQKMMSAASNEVDFDKSVGTKFDYADTQQYKHLLAARATDCGLIFSVNFFETQFLGVVNQVNGKLEGTSIMYGAIVKGQAILEDVCSGALQTIDIVGMGTNTTPGYVIGAAQTNALRSYIFNNFLMDNTGRDGDDIGLMGADDHKKAPVNAYMKPEDKPAAVKDIIAAKGEQMVTLLYAKELYDTIQQALAIDPTFKATKILEECFKDGEPIVGEDGNSIIEKTRCNRAMEKAELVIASKED